MYSAFNHLNIFCFLKIQDVVKNGHLDITMNLLKTSRCLETLLSLLWLIQTKLFVNCISISILYAYFRLWQPICKIRKGKCYNSWISLLFTKSGATRIEILLSRQERLLFKTSEQRFWATPGHKGYFEITRERKTEVQEYDLQHKIKDVCLKSCKNGRTWRCFRDNVT